MFDIQSFLYNILEQEKITYKDPGSYGCQEKNTYSIILHYIILIFSLIVKGFGAFSTKFERNLTILILLYISKALENELNI